jgi:ribonuclease BN (tRNA processing enzyme)
MPGHGRISLRLQETIKRKPLHEENLKITVLGAGTCIPYPNFSPAGYLVYIDQKPLLLDAGPGTIARMASQGVNYQDLEFILISHLHPDHVLDLLTLLQVYNATPGWTRTEKLTVIGCRGIEYFLQEQYRLFDGVKPENYPLQIYEMNAETIDFEGWSLVSALSLHTPESLAFRITSKGKSLVISGDASSPDNLIELARGADLLICECSFPSGWESPDHLSPYQVCMLAKNASVKRVVLTHRYPQAIQEDVVSQVKALYDGEVIGAIDGWSTEI